MLLTLKPATGQVLIVPGRTALWQGLGADVFRLTNSATDCCPRKGPNERPVELPRDATTTTITISAAVKRRRNVDVASEYTIALNSHGLLETWLRTRLSCN
jgi:hypothetical protein